MIAVALTLALYEIGARYIKFNYVPILYNYIVEVGIQHMYLSASVCQHDTTPRNVEAQASHLSSPLPTHAMHVATRLIHLYLMYPRTICFVYSPVPPARQLCLLWQLASH